MALVFFKTICMSSIIYQLWFKVSFPLSPRFSLSFLPASCLLACRQNHQGTGFVVCGPVWLPGVKGFPQTRLSAGSEQARVALLPWSLPDTWGGLKERSDVDDVDDVDDVFPGSENGGASPPDASQRPSPPPRVSESWLPWPTLLSPPPHLTNSRWRRSQRSTLLESILLVSLCRID